MNLRAESILEHPHAVHESLSHLEALGGCEAEHPEDDVVVVPFAHRRHRDLGSGLAGVLVSGGKGVRGVAHGSMVAGWPPGP